MESRLRGGGVPAALALSTIGAAPCSRACPAGINVKRYVGLAAEGRWEEALAVVRRDNPLAAVCGYLCNRPCEVECSAHASGAPIPIRALKRMAARIVADGGARPQVTASLAGRAVSESLMHVAPTPKRVAVVGGGPAGLTAARDLRVAGLGVTILEARERLGGMLALEVPEARLPRWALAADLEYILAHDIEVRTGHPVGGEGGLDALFEEGFHAVLLATGAGRALGGDLPGERDSDAVRPALTLLRELAGGDAPTFREAVVIGANPVGFAAATALAGLGVGSVTLIHERGLRELPVDPATLDEAERAGVQLCTGTRAEEIEVGDGLVTGVVVVQMEQTSARQAGRHGLAEGKRTLWPADFVVTALEREPDLSYLEGQGDAAPTVRKTVLGTVDVLRGSLETHRRRVFATGESVAGPRSVIEMVALGRRAAAEIVTSLSEKPRAARGVSVGGFRLSSQPNQLSRWRHFDAPDEPADRDGERGPFGLFAHAARPEAARLEPAALEAARRCERCGPCVDCAACSAHCPEGHVVEPGGELLRAPRGEDPATLPGLVRTTAKVDAARCRACGLCEEHCPYAAPRVVTRANGRAFSRVDEAACRGCGICVGLCPTGALEQGGFDNARLADEVDRLLAPKEVSP